MARTKLAFAVACGFLTLAAAVWWLTPATSIDSSRTHPGIADPAPVITDSAIVRPKSVDGTLRQDANAKVDAAPPVSRENTAGPSELVPAEEATTHSGAISNLSPNEAPSARLTPVDPASAKPPAGGRPGGVAPPGPVEGRETQDEDAPDRYEAEGVESAQAELFAALDNDPLIVAVRDALKEVWRSRRSAVAAADDEFWEKAGDLNKMPEPEGKALFERLWSLAHEHPDDPASPHALAHAGELAEWFVPERAIEAYLAAARHPLAGPDRRRHALFRASDITLHRLGDIVTSFQLLNEALLAIDEMEKATGADCAHERFLVAKFKAAGIQHCRLLKIPVPALPPPDTGKSESDLMLEVLAFDSHLSPELQFQNRLSLANSLAAEGRDEEALAAYQELCHHPGHQAPSSNLLRMAAWRIDPEQGNRYVAILESAEREMPRDAGWRDLNYSIAQWHRDRGDPGEWLARVEPLLDSDDPEDFAWVHQNEQFYGNLLDGTAMAYMRPQVADLDKAYALYARLVNELPNHHAAKGALEMLEFIEEARARARESAEPSPRRDDHEE